MDVLISKRAVNTLVDELARSLSDRRNGLSRGRDYAEIMLDIIALQPVKPTLYGYDIRHLALIASILQKENLPPERVEEALTDIERVVTIIEDEFEASLRMAFEHFKEGEAE